MLVPAVATHGGASSISAMDKNEVAAVLEEIGTLLELKGENPFKTRAYHNAVRVLEALEGRAERHVPGLLPAMLQVPTPPPAPHARPTHPRAGSLRGRIQRVLFTH